MKQEESVHFCTPAITCMELMGLNARINAHSIVYTASGAVVGDQPRSTCLCSRVTGHPY